MKKIFIVMVVVATSIACFSSCKKCSTCTAYDSTGDQIISSGEFCGPKKEVNDTEAMYKTIWGQGDATVTCK